jgi:chromosome segregation ATPase
MKSGFTLKNLSYIALILLAIMIYLRFIRSTESNRELKQQIKELELKNDSIQAHVDSTLIQITQLNVIAEGYKVQIEEDKQQLANLQSKADLYKRKYNEEHSRITELSGDALVSEFTNAFK